MSARYTSRANLHNESHADLVIFTDRTHAGTLLAQKLAPYASAAACVVGLARGGVAVAKILADGLNLPLDVLVVKKVGAPGEAELAIGALAPDGVSFIDWRFAQMLGVDEGYIKRVISDKREVIREKTLLYRKKKKPYRFREKTVILVDDGAATGATIEAAIRWLRKKHAKRIVVAIPVAPKELAPKIAPEVDKLVVLETPEGFGAVGQFYTDFPQVSDEEVVELLRNKSEARSTT